MAVTRLIGVEELKQNIAKRINILDVAESLGLELLPAGSQKKCLCPFHTEKTPSFYLNPNKGPFGVMHCFSCKAGGDAIELVQQVKHFAFPEAMEWLATECGVDISQYQRPPTEAEKRIDRIRAACEKWIMDLDPNPKFRVKATVAHELDIGYSLGWPGDHFGVDDLKREELFKKMVIFPYRLPDGRLVGWKSRTLDGVEPRRMYGVSRKFPLYAPTLFGIDRAREHFREAGEAVVVEGEWDTAVCHEAGFKHVVGTGGSSFTDEHMQMLKDLRVHRVILAFDPDTGGNTGLQRVAENWWNDDDVSVRIAELRGGDPEDVIRKQGIGSFAFALSDAKHALEWLLWREWVTRGDALGDKLDFVKWVRAQYGDKLRTHEEAMVMQQIAKWLELPEAQVLDLVRSEGGALAVPDSEQAVLGRSIHDIGYFRDVRKRITMDDFYLVRNRRLWETLTRMLTEGMDFDVTTAAAMASHNGVDPEYVELAAEQGIANLNWHEEQVVSMATRRQARDAADRFRGRIADISVDSKALIGDLTLQITERILKSGGEQKQIAEQVDEAMELLHERMRNPSAIHGLDVGPQFPRLMEKMQGIQQRRLCLVLANTSIGKSTLTIQWATSMAILESIPCDFISLEMDEDEIIFKMVAHLTGIDSWKISGGRIDDKEQKLVEQAMGLLRRCPLRIYAPSGITPSEFHLYCRESVIERRSEAFFLDYAQLVGPDPGMEKASSYEQLGELSKLCKQKVARSMDVAVVACAQLKREAASKERPTKEDVGDSYAMVRDADVVIILKGYGEDDPETVDMWVDKNRQGSANLLNPLRFDVKAQTFYEATTTRVPEYRCA